jgi:hypothetical protein
MEYLPLFYECIACLLILHECRMCYTAILPGFQRFLFHLLRLRMLVGSAINYSSTVRSPLNIAKATMKMSITVGVLYTSSNLACTEAKYSYWQPLFATLQMLPRYAFKKI